MLERSIARVASLLALSGLVMLGSNGIASGGTLSEAVPITSPPGRNQARFDPASPSPIVSPGAGSEIRESVAAAAPADVTRTGLRRLCTTDSVWALPERLDLHNLDYAFPTVPDRVETAYRVGLGYPDATAARSEMARR